ncbi:MAG TPA: hypothetical protein VIV12_04575 [Streptosporangiaceae bacterium]
MLGVLTRPLHHPRALDEELDLPGAGAELEWVNRFRGTEARNRRGLKDPREWEAVLRPQLIQAQRTLRSLGARRILVTGTMRLPTGFTAGVMFQETAGFTPAKIKDGQLWVKPAGVPLSLRRSPCRLPSSKAAWPTARAWAWMGAQMGARFAPRCSPPLQLARLCTA